MQRISLKVLSLAACLTLTTSCTSTPAQAVQAPPFNPAACIERSLDVYFSAWDAKIEPDAQEALRAGQAALTGCKINRVRIVGMAGAEGDAAANDEISRQRAENIAALLEAGGWSRSVFEIEAVGEQNATTEAGLDRPMRRRVRVTVQSSAP
jgi:peptidoglycan-associated lipoprotein